MFFVKYYLTNRGALMLKSFFDFGKAECFNSGMEECFKKEVQRETGVTVLQTLYEEGLVENNIRIWVDFSTTIDDRVLKLYNLVKSNMTGNSIDEISVENDVGFLVEKLTDLFLLHMDKNIEQDKKTRIYIYDFITEVKKYIYGNALATIRVQLSEKYDLINIFVFGEPMFKIVCKNLEQKIFCQNNYKNIVDICYEGMKKFDNYNVLQKDDVLIDILCETEIDAQRLNDYFMKK